MSKKKRIYVGRGRYNPQTYRGKDVTGALAFVRSLMEWDLMPLDDRPKTDREAASLFFQIDRSGANMDEFLASLKEFTVAELERLTTQQRKPPKQVKKLVGFVNVLTGEQRPAFPDFIVLPASTYDQLLDLVRWVESTPTCVDLPDSAWEGIHDTMADLLEVDDTAYPGVYVDNVQIETIETMQRNITPGTLVALLMHEDSDDSGEHHCVLVRGNEDEE